MEGLEQKRPFQEFGSRASVSTENLDVKLRYVRKAHTPDGLTRKMCTIAWDIAPKCKGVVVFATPANCDVQYFPSLCRKMDSNRHLRRSINPLRFSFRRYFSRVSAIFHTHFLATLVIDFIEQGIEIFVSSFFLDVPHNGIHSKRKQF